MSNQSLDLTSNDATLNASESETSDSRNNKRPIPFENEHFKRSCMRLYLQEETADVHFVFHTAGEEKRLPAHKYMLGISSPVFQSMFYGTLKEEGDVKIVDATMDGFKEFLQFFYMDQVIITIENIAEIMNLVKKYGVLKCFDMCDTFLMKNLSIQNICLGLELAITFDRSELRQFCLSKIMEEPTKLFTLDSFKKCSPDILKLILECELKCEEETIFSACMVWADNACVKNELDPSDMMNRREMLGDCFNLIQFAVMKPIHISKAISKYNDLFKREELIEIIAILSSDNTKLQYFTRNTRVRSVEWNGNDIMIFSQIDAPVDYVNQIEITCFKTNKTMLLGAIATDIVNPWTSDKKELSTIMQIIEPENGNKILLEQPFIIALGGRFVPRNVTKLDKPINIQAHKHYRIRIKFYSSWSDEVYVTKKCTSAQSHVLKEYRLVFGGGIISHLYFN